LEERGHGRGSAAQGTARVKDQIQRQRDDRQRILAAAWRRRVGQGYYFFKSSTSARASSRSRRAC
jgi:hypothetical protein